jgi:hypothetical protein
VPRIKFTSDYAVKAKGGPKWKAGQEAVLSADSANHYVSRGLAVEISDEEPAAAPVAPPKAVESDADGDGGKAEAGAAPVPPAPPAAGQKGGKGGKPAAQ